MGSAFRNNNNFLYKSNRRKQMKFDIKTVSEANQREHWAVKSKRKKAQQRDFSMIFKSKRPNVPIPAKITFTRYSCQTMDADNLAGAFKHVQDQLCREIGIDDGDDRLTFVYSQERISKREHYFTVKMEAR